MGFGTILGMHNLRAFLFDFAENLPKRSDVKVKVIEGRSNAQLKAQGQNPGLSYLKITKDEKVILEVDAFDAEDGYDAIGDADLRSAIDKMNMDLALELYSKLIQ
jgi:hypothetical protein